MIGFLVFFVCCVGAFDAAFNQIQSRHVVENLVKSFGADEAQDFDVFERLSDTELSRQWTYEIFENVTGLLENLVSMREDLQLIEEATHIRLYLLGEKQTRHLARVKNLLASLPVSLAASLDGERLIGKKIDYDVQGGSALIEQRIRGAIDAYVRASGAKNVYERVLIPMKVVDELLRELYDDVAHGDSAVFIFDGSGGSKQQYAYVADNDVVSERVYCPSNVFLGGEQRRFVWIDIGAGPVSYGPLSSGEGGVSVMSGHLWAPKYESADAAATEFVAEMVSFVHAAEQFVFAPSAAHGRMAKQYAQVMFVTVHEGALDRSKQQNRDRYYRDIVQEVPRRVQYFEQQIALAECVECQVALEMARGDDGAQLDSIVLRNVLRRLQSEFVRGVRIEDTLLVYTFELRELALLDGKLQAVPFDDMVLAVESSTAIQVQSDFYCHTSVRVGDGTYRSAQQTPMHVTSNDASAATVAATLTALFGVAPTHETREGGATLTKHNYLFSATGHTPFGAFAALRRADSLSFALLDAAQRHPIMDRLNATMVALSDAFDAFLLYSHELDSLLPLPVYHRFVQRWTLFRFKLHWSMRSLSLHEFLNAEKFLRAARFDVADMSKILFDTASSMGTQLYCLTDAEHKQTRDRITQRHARENYWFFLMVVGTIALLGIFVCVKLTRGGKRKKRS